MNLTNSLKHNKLHVNFWSPKNPQGNILYIHGGPGNNSINFENMICELDAYNDGPFSFITYDQRGCGRSTSEGTLTHESNLEDIISLYQYLSQQEGIKIDAIVGHSYGARLAFNLAEKLNPNSKIILLGFSNIYGQPRVRSLLMELIALKIKSPIDYQNLLTTYESKSELKEKKNDIREMLGGHNEIRKYFYWGNLKAMELYEKVKEKSELPETNLDTYNKVLKSLYSEKNNPKITDYSTTNSDVTSIIGFHDFLMSGETNQNGPKNKAIQFLKSGHYPHYEEPELFLKTLKDIINGN